MNILVFAMPHPCSSYPYLDYSYITRTIASRMFDPVLYRFMVFTRSAKFYYPYSEFLRIIDEVTRHIHSIMFAGVSGRSYTTQWEELYNSVGGAIQLSGKVQN